MDVLAVAVVGGIALLCVCDFVAFGVVGEVLPLLLPLFCPPRLLRFSSLPGTGPVRPVAPKTVKPCYGAVACPTPLQQGPLHASLALSLSMRAADHYPRPGSLEVDVVNTYPTS